MTIQITNRWTANILFECEADSLKLGLELAVEQGADLRGADLQVANLRGADLQGAYLRGADLQVAYLQDANLRGANLQGAYLQGADLRGADLRGADLQDANLRGANLQGAYLRGAYLQDAYLRGANLTPIRDDFWAVLSSAPVEVEGLRQAVIEGRIDGSQYEGECACLVGTIANVRHCNYQEIETLKPDVDRPAERFFLAIKKGDTPATSQFSKIVLEWIDAWPPLECVRKATELST